MFILFQIGIITPILYILYLHANLPKGTKTLPIAEWEQEYADLKTQRDSDYTKLKDTRTNVSELQKIRKCVDKLGDITVDFSGYTASDENGKIDITPKELEILKVLIDNKGLMSHAATFH